jgi:endonuclease/exonuclease/phosphatase family metal-dependent hydrolase
MRLSSWNLEGRLSEPGDKSKRGSAAAILDRLNNSESDVMILPESHIGELSDNVIGQLCEIAGLDGQVITTNYAPVDEPYDFELTRYSNITLLSRLPVEQFDIIRLGQFRNAIRALIDGIVVYGVHLDDRAESTRQAMAQDLIIDTKTMSVPTVIAGDFNATFDYGVLVRMMRAAAWAGSKIIKDDGTSRMGSLLRRSFEMTDGGTMDLFREAGFVETNPRHKPTETLKQRGLEFIPSVPFLQLDHILYAGGAGLRAFDFHIHPDGGSDHREISVTIEGE